MDTAHEDGQSLFIDETQTYYVKGKAKEIPAARVGGGPGHAYMDMAIAHVLSAAPGAGVLRCRTR